MNREGFDPTILTEKLKSGLVDVNKKAVLLAPIPSEDVHNSSFAFTNTTIDSENYGLVLRSITNRDKDANAEKQKWPIIDIYEEVPMLRGGLSKEDVAATELYRLAGCNIRCWFCFVDWKYLKANPKYARFTSASELIDAYQASSFQPKVMCLSGGQPDLVPEWPIWMIEELQKRNLFSKMYLWQDDNLLTPHDKVLSLEQIEFLTSQPNYSRASCLKGFDYESFNKNTGANPKFLDRQIENLSKLVKNGFDVYSYIILMGSHPNQAKSTIPQFIDRLITEVDPNMPLRILPSKVVLYPETKKRLGVSENEKFLDEQHDLLEIWNDAMVARYTNTELNTHPSKIRLNIR